MSVHQGGFSLPGGLPPDVLPRSPTLPPFAIPPLPRHLVFPLRQSRGIFLIPRMESGQSVLKGQVLADHPEHPPLHASSSGLAEISPDGSRIMIRTDGRDTPLLATPPPRSNPLTRENLLERIWQAGITGLGGAGYPSADKLLSPTLHTLILNGVECEPLASCDQTLLTRFPHRVLAGARQLCQTLGFNRCLLAIEADKTEVRQILQASLADHRYDPVRLVSVPVRYPAGSEKQLIQVLTGLEVPQAKKPQDIGLVCLNVATVAALHDALTWQEPLISRLVTVTGSGIKKPHNLWVRTGTLVADLIDYCGGYTQMGVHRVTGGCMMGQPLESDQVPVGKSTYCLWIAGAEEWVEKQPEQPCIRCGACVEVCPAGLLPQELYRYTRSGHREHGMALHLDACIACGCCDVVCPSHIPLAESFRHAQAKQAEWLQGQVRASHAKARYEARLARKAREEQEQIEHARRKKENLGKNRDDEIQKTLNRLKTRREPG